MEELLRFREDSLHHVDAYERACLDRDRYRRERDALRGDRAGVARDSVGLPANSPPVRREAARDPYPPIRCCEDVKEVPRHPGYCPQTLMDQPQRGSFPKPIIDSEAWS